MMELSDLIKIILMRYFRLKVFKISIDDFYKTRKERIILSKKIHPLLKTRGVPGTHDIDMMLNLFRKVNIEISIRVRWFRWFRCFMFRSDEIFLEFFTKFVFIILFYNKLII